MNFSLLKSKGAQSQNVANLLTKKRLTSFVAQVVEVSSRYDDTCITGTTNVARNAALLQVS